MLAICCGVARSLPRSSASDSTTLVALEVFSRCGVLSRSARIDLDHAVRRLVSSSGAVSQAKTMAGTRHFPAWAKTLVASVSEIPRRISRPCWRWRARSPPCDRRRDRIRRPARSSPSCRALRVFLGKSSFSLYMRRTFVCRLGDEDVAMFELGISSKLSVKKWPDPVRTRPARRLKFRHGRTSSTAARLVTHGPGMRLIGGRARGQACQFGAKCRRAGNVEGSMLVLQK